MSGETGVAGVVNVDEAGAAGASGAAKVGGIAAVAEKTVSADATGVICENEAAAAATVQRPLGVQLDQWGWRHPGRKQWALRDLTLTLQPGEKVLLVGASGAGKSTLLHGICGLLAGDEGEEGGGLRLFAPPPAPNETAKAVEPTEFAESGEFAGLTDPTESTEAAEPAGFVEFAAGDPRLRGAIGLVQQDPEAQICMERVGDEVAFGLENLGVPREQIWPRVRAALREMELPVPLTHSTSQLSGGQKQRLAIAAALAMQPGLLLLDEPTANLDQAGTSAVRSCIARVQAATGATTIIVEHRLGTWLDFVDRLVVLGREGIIADGTPQEVLAAQTETLLAAGVWVPGSDPQLGRAKRAAAAFSPAAPVPVSSSPASSAATSPTPSALTTSNLAVGYDPDDPVLADFNLAVKTGCSTCIVGPNGAGKSTLALTLAGLLEPLAGQVQVAPGITGSALALDPHQWKSPELLGRISMVFQEPGYQFVTNTVRGELEASLKHLHLSAQEMRARTDRMLAALGLEDLAWANPFTLSGGERRRLSVASALVCAPKILILDEPTFGQDRNTWIALVELLQEVTASGTTVISITHDDLLVETLGEEVVAVTPRRRAVKEQEECQPAANQPRRSSYPKPAPISRVNPVIQTLGVAAMTLPLIATVDWVSASVALCLEVLLLPLLGLRTRQIFARLSLLLMLAPLTAVSLLLYGDPEGQIYWAWGPVVISENSVGLAVAIVIRIVAVGAPCILVFAQLDPLDMADGMTQILHLPARVVFSSVAGLRMAYLMRSDWFALQRARRSRGLAEGNPLRAFFRGAFAMLVFALQRAGTLSLTMEARGFGGTTPRSYARVSTTSRADLVMLLVSVAVPVLALGTAIVTGEFRWFGL